ncbi:MAG: hypothetical protein JST28_22385 [Acidobacteria bacterium]|nr:hypothetical protein [Acidobacteriota bacterium]
MVRHSLLPADPSFVARVFSITCSGALIAVLCAPAPHATAQAITIDTRTGNVSTGGSTVDRRYAQITPTKVDLPKTGLDAKTRLELIRVLQSEQGFAMRPFPRGHKGLTLQANGDLNPAGENYLNMVTQYGLSAKPGDAVVLTDIKFDKNKMVFMLNGGPDLKHRFLRHIQLGAGTQMTPMVQGGDESEPLGARLTLEFKGGVPSMTASQVKALLAPLISFDVKTPIQAFTDTLPPKLKEAILNHDVWVGMSTDMVLFAKGQPQRKVREVEGQMPFEEWIYGQTPQPVEFVRINGNRVIRVEVAKVGEAPQIFDQDVVEGLMRTDGTPAVATAEQQKTRIVQVGDSDTNRDPNRQAPAPPPSLTAPGEQLPDTAKNGAGQMKPVQFPKQKPDDYPDVAAARRADQAKAADSANKSDSGTDKLDVTKDGKTVPALAPSSKAPAPPADPDDQ